MSQRAEMIAWIDDLGRPAWIALMVLGFILFWPIGLAILAYLIWSGRMGCGRHADWGRWQSRMAGRWDRQQERWQRAASAYSPSGNRAFDEYREQTLKRLEDEQREFREFLERLRLAKDRAEFDQFMAERRTNGPTPEPPPASA